jgi:hypothetical protein
MDDKDLWLRAIEAENQRLSELPSDRNSPGYMILHGNDTNSPGVSPTNIEAADDYIQSKQEQLMEGQPVPRWRITRRDMGVLILGGFLALLAWDYYRVRTWSQMGAASYQFLTQKIEAQKKAEGPK